MDILIKWLIAALAIVLTAWVLPGIVVSGFWAALWLALFLGLLNVIIKPVLIVLTLPINILTLGLFTFVINAALVLLAESVIKGFAVDGFLWALAFSIVLSAATYILHTIFGAK